MIRCLKLGIDTVHTSIVSVYSADTDGFFLLLSCSEKLDCSSLAQAHTVIGMWVG